MKDTQHGSSAPDDHHLPPGELAPVSGAVPVQASSPALAMGSPFAASTAQDVINGGIDASTLFHSFRRRWPLALLLGLVVGGLAAFGLYKSLPESATAYKLFQVDSAQQSIIENSIGISSTVNYDIYRKTSLVLIRSPRVINAALRSAGISQSSFFNDVEEVDKLRYLQEQLKVNFQQDSEILEIRLSGAAKPEELKAIVEAVGDAYLEEVLFEERLRSKKPRDILAESYEDLDEEIKRKQDSLDARVQDSGNSNMYVGQDPEVLQMRSQMLGLSKQIGSLEGRLYDAAMNYEVLKRQYEDPAALDQRISAAVNSDPKYQALQQKKLGIELYVLDLKSSHKNRSSAQIRQYERRAEEIAQQMNGISQQITAGLKQKYRTEPDPALTALTRQYQITRAGLAQQIERTKSEQTQLLEKIKEKSMIDSDLLSRESEIAGLKAVQSSIAKRIEQWDIELRRPDRVRAASGSDTSAGINRTQRIAIAGIGGLGSLAFVVFGISYLEFRNRKLNGPDQIDQGLGIRVVGTLPSLGGRKKLDPSHPVVAQLTESVDSVRTALMHESTTRRRQIVLVTSPSTLEGRTTVASQLAASLARAGRRTLLIDGDLRRPALHTLFDLPLEDGLSEVLRAEVEVADVVRPTHAEGLWVLTAGYCDSDAIHALATDQVQPIFDRLRSDYDFVVIDGAPVLGLSDSLLFGQHCDGAILSVMRDQTNLPKIHQSAELLRNVGIRLIGAVVNGVRGAADRRVTALQSVTAKSERKQLQNIDA